MSNTKDIPTTTQQREAYEVGSTTTKTRLGIQGHLTWDEVTTVLTYYHVGVLCDHLGLGRNVRHLLAELMVYPIIKKRFGGALAVFSFS
jgi:hypothetical protein